MIKSHTLIVIILNLLAIAISYCAYDYGYRKGTERLDLEDNMAYQIGFEDGHKDANAEAARLAALYVNDQWELYIKHYCWDIDEKVEAALLPKDSQASSTLKMCLWKRGETE